MSKTLHLPLKAQWYDMIEAGIKTEEYREVKPYWVTRICKYGFGKLCSDRLWKGCSECKYHNGIHTNITEVCFSYGYTKRRMTFKVAKIYISMGDQEWGAPANKKVFIITLGERIK